MTEQENIEKKIKRNIYGKPQSILVIFPPGLSGIAHEEAEFILGHLWFQNKFESTITILKNALRIDQIHMSAVMELMMRGQCCTDIRLILSEGKVANMPVFEKKCEDIFWNFYVTPKMSVKLKVDVGASPALHEGAMREVLMNVLGDKIKRMVKGEDSEETTTIYVDVYKNNSLMSISLAGDPLYKRGYRSILSNSAPLREDIAASCILNALQFGAENNADFTREALLIPFSGTGTFLFEYWQIANLFAPVLFNRAYALQFMPLFRSDNYNYLLKKARDNCLMSSFVPTNFYCIDNTQATHDALLKNMTNFKQAVVDNQFEWQDMENNNWLHDEDFLQMDIEKLFVDAPRNVFMPINPPYGIRLGKSSETVKLYQQTARQINALSHTLKASGKNVLGFILCPSEDAWSQFCKTLMKANVYTYHITQGGLDIRVAQFYI